MHLRCFKTSHFWLMPTNQYITPKYIEVLMDGISPHDKGAFTEAMELQAVSCDEAVGLLMIFLWRCALINNTPVKPWSDGTTQRTMRPAGNVLTAGRVPFSPALILFHQLTFLPYLSISFPPRRSHPILRHPFHRRASFVNVLKLGPNPTCMPTSNSS